MRVDQQYIEDRVELVPESGCWVWMKATYPGGYGHICKRGKHMTAHKAAYEAFIGHVPTGMCVLHRCDVPECCNPSHLWIGTKKDNSDDMMRKGRAKHLRGEDHPNSKFTVSQIKDIKERRSAGEAISVIANAYGVWATTIEYIVKGRRWASV